MGGDDVVDWIGWVRAVDGVPPEPTPVEFLTIQYAGRRYLVHTSSLWWLDPPCDWFGEVIDYQHPWRRTLRWSPRRRLDRRPHLGWFAMEETAGTDFLKLSTGIIQDGGRSVPAMLRLPSLMPLGFGLGGTSVGRG
jgi:hypothetical protein